LTPSPRGAWFERIDAAVAPYAFQFHGRTPPSAKPNGQLPNSSRKGAYRWPRRRPWRQSRAARNHSDCPRNGEESAAAADRRDEWALVEDH